MFLLKEGDVILLPTRAGFVHSDMDGDEEPGYDEVAHVHDVFSKHSLKEIRKQHPLFARGSDDKLNFIVRLFVYIS